MWRKNALSLLTEAPQIYAQPDWSLLTAPSRTGAEDSSSNLAIASAHSRQTCTSLLPWVGVVLT